MHGRKINLFSRKRVATWFQQFLLQIHMGIREYGFL
jgi:hypothetical protein